MLSTLLHTRRSGRAKGESVYRLNWYRRRHPPDYGIRFPPLPQLTNVWLLTTSSAFVCCLKCCLHRTYEKHGSRGHREEQPCCLECCCSDDPRRCSEKSALKPTTITHRQINDDRHVSRTVGATTQIATARWQGGDTEYPLAGLLIMIALGDYSRWVSEDVGEKRLYYSQGRDGIWRCGALARLISWLSRTQDVILTTHKRTNDLFLR